MPELLALKWRPKSFSEVVGQDKAVRLLSKSVQLRRYFPCYLISGPFGAGKTSLARIFAKAVLCESRDQGNGEPCHSCSSCREFDESTNSNYLELDSASHGSVEDIRRLRDEALFRPLGGRPRRVVYLDEAGSITRAGNNAFLKLLEEGSESVLFLMTTTDPDNILDTVKSRAFEIDLSKITTNDIFARLLHVCEVEKIQAEGKALRLISSYAQGHMRDALMLLDQMLILGSITEDVCRSMLKVDTKIELLKLYHAVPTNFQMMLDLLSALESRMTPIEVWRGLLEASLDCYLMYRSVKTDQDPVELEWTKKVTEQGAVFLTSSMQLMQQLPSPHTMIDLRFNLYQMAEKLGKKGSMPTNQSASQLRNLATRQPSAQTSTPVGSVGR